MSTLNTRQPEFSRRSSSKYEPAELTSELVWEFAPLLSQVKLAKLFKISPETLMANFGPIYHQSVVAHEKKRRAKFEELLDQLEPAAPGERDEFGYHHGHKDAKTSEYIAAFKVRYGEAPKVEEPETTDNQMASKTPEELQAMMEAWALANGYVKEQK